jgi:hypothetical protein
VTTIIVTNSRSQNFDEQDAFTCNVTTMRSIREWKGKGDKGKTNFRPEAQYHLKIIGYTYYSWPAALLNA